MGIHPLLIYCSSLVNEFRIYATGKKNSPQIFVTTHRPYFVDALFPSEMWILEKNPEGFSTVKRASDDPIVKGMVEEGLPLGNCRICPRLLLEIGKKRRSSQLKKIEHCQLPQ